MLSRSDESSYPCLVPDPRGKHLVFLSVMLAVYLSIRVFTLLLYMQLSLINI